MNIKAVAGKSKQTKLIQLIESYAEQHLFNGNVIVADKGEIICKCSKGYADRKMKRPLTEDTVFNVASVAKTFTSAAILLLQQQGKLLLDDRVQKWLPDIPYKGVNIRHLLAHTSGIPNYIRPVRQGAFANRWNMNKLATNEDLLVAVYEAYPDTEFIPNSQNEYSNTAYIILAQLIERISGVSFEDFLQREIFDPLELSRTYVSRSVHRASQIDNYAIGYFLSNRDPEQARLPHQLHGMSFSYYLDQLVGDGNVHSTSSDLLKWDQALRNGKFLNRLALEEAYATVNTSNGEKAPNGLGWFVDISEDKGKRVEHFGYWPGYGAVLRRYLDKEKTIIVLSNEEYDDAHLSRQRMLKEIEDIVFE